MQYLSAIFQRTATTVHLLRPSDWKLIKKNTHTAVTLYFHNNRLFRATVHEVSERSPHDYYAYGLLEAKSEGDKLPSYRITFTQRRTHKIDSPTQTSTVRKETKETVKYHTGVLLRILIFHVT